MSVARGSAQIDAPPRISMLATGQIGVTAIFFDVVAARGNVQPALRRWRATTAAPARRVQRIPRAARRPQARRTSPSRR
jgi:hypothetical protein